MSNVTRTRINEIRSVRLAGRAARLFMAWGNRAAADAAHMKRAELQVALCGGRARYNHQ